MIQYFPIKRQSTGFALPMTIIAISGLILLLVGLITVLSLERKTARSYSNTERAELAVESGLASALVAISEVARRDDSLVFRLEDPDNPKLSTSERPLGFREQFFTYGAVFENGSWKGIPFFSGAPEADLGSGQIDTSNLSSDLSSYAADAKQIGRITEHNQNIPRAQWVEIPAIPSDKEDYTIRYAYWVEDLGGRIDGKSVGKIARGEGRSVAEIDISTILDPSVESGMLPAPLDEKRDLLRTSASVRTLLSKADAKRIEPYINYHAPPSGVIAPPKLIPRGFGYADAGLPAPDLNEFVTTGDIDGLAEHIERNLPLFKNRRGGFPTTEDYVKTIAASIIDYADADSDATVGIGYRGIDSYPFVNELFDRYEWISSPPGSVSIDVDTYLELWNPSDRQITGSITFNNINKRQIKLGGNGTKNFTTASYGPVATTIPPNGFRVIPLGKKNYTFNVSLEPAAPLTFNDTDTDSSFELFWNGILVDFSRGGLERTYGFLRAGLSERKWKGNSSPSSDLAKGQVGDPRASIYIEDYFHKSDYDGNSNWGGRAIKRNLPKKYLFREVRLEKWPDRGSNSTVGVAAGTDARVPTDFRIILKSSGAAIAGKDFPPNQPELAPARISNGGKYKSLGELGTIFDPAQWMDLEKSAATESSIAGGGITLAVGRPEYVAFDQEGRRAGQLLDLFFLKKSSTALLPTININTAPREVLRSLIAGVVLDEDPVATDLEIAKKPVNPAIGDIFADQVIAYRNSHPLRSVSDLNLVREKPLIARDYDSADDQPFFGNPKNFVNVPIIEERPDPNQEYDQTVYKEWNDSGREELFKKVMDLVSYRSNIFRIVVVGEIIDSSGKRTARSVREYHIGLYPQRDADGIIIPNSPLIFKKFYEKSL